jgi:hypothetical protein
MTQHKPRTLAKTALSVEFPCNNGIYWPADPLQFLKRPCPTYVPFVMRSVVHTGRWIPLLSLQYYLRFKNNERNLIQSSVQMTNDCYALLVE